MKFILPLVLSLSLVFCSCKSSKYTPIDFPKRQIIFGSGGGVTGKYETYTLLENGQMFYENSLTGKLSELPGVRKKIVKGMLREMKEMNFKTNTFDSPGNFNYFVKLKEDGEIYSAQWGDDKKTDPEYKELHKSLMNLIKSDS